MKELAAKSGFELINVGVDRWTRFMKERVAHRHASATAEACAVYEQDFVRFSYGFRPARSPHQAPESLSVGITQRMAPGC